MKRKRGRPNTIGNMKEYKREWNRKKRQKFKEELTLFTIFRSLPTTAGEKRVPFPLFKIPFNIPIQILSLTNDVILRCFRNYLPTKLTDTLLHSTRRLM